MAIWKSLFPPWCLKWYKWRKFQSLFYFFVIVPRNDENIKTRSPSFGFSSTPILAKSWMGLPNHSLYVEYLQVYTSTGWARIRPILKAGRGSGCCTGIGHFNNYSPGQIPFLQLPKIQHLTSINQHSKRSGFWYKIQLEWGNYSPFDQNFSGEMLQGNCGICSRHDHVHINHCVTTYMVDVIVQIS